MNSPEILLDLILGKKREGFAWVLADKDATSKVAAEEAMQTANCAGVVQTDLREFAAPKAEDSELEEKYSAGDRYFKGEMPRLTKIQQ